YFAMVTITTVGFGVPAPVTLGGRTFVVFFGACGIVLLAMVITSIRYVILEDLHRRFTARAHERKARKEEWRRKQHMHRQIPFQRQQQRLREALNRIRHSHDSARIDSSSVENAVNLSPCFPQRLDPLLIQPKDKVRLSPSDKNGRDFNGEDIEGDGSIPPAGQLKISDNRLENSECTWSDMPNSNEVQPNGHIIFADCVGEHTLENRPSNAIQLNQETHPSPAVRGLSALLKRIAMAFKRISTKASAETRTLNSVDQQEEDRRQAYDESMEEYRRRLYFSTTMFFIFWLAGALIFMFIESWDFGTSCYFIFVVFSTIGYGDVTPQTNAGRAVFLAYCLLGVATLTSLASLMSEVLGKTMRKHLVDSQLRREENLRQLEGISGQDTTLSIDLEAGQGDDEGDFISTAHLLSEDNAVIEENENQGTLHKLISASKELDEALQSLIGPDYSDPKPKGPKTLDQDERLDKNSGHIVQFLEEEDNECDLVYQDMGKDMESIMAPLQRPKMPKQSQSHSSNRDTRDLKREHEASLQDSREDPSQGNSTRPLSMGSNAASNLDWQQLVQCAKQIKALAQECEHSVHQIHEWAELEKRAHQRQVLIRERQKQVLEVRRARRERLGVQRGDIEDDIQDEEELEYWGEEEDHGENKIGTLDKQRASITVMLLGRSYGNSTIAPATDPTTTAAPKRSTTEPPQGAPRIPEPISNLQYRRRTFRTLGSRE
ncbi:hypothetical protein BGW38_004048, partial [Lunasporangiospora selenospora]